MTWFAAGFFATLGVIAALVLLVCIGEVASAVYDARGKRGKR